MNRMQALQFLVGWSATKRVREPTRAHEVNLGDGVTASVTSTDGATTMAVEFRHEAGGQLCAIELCPEAAEALASVVLAHADRLPARLAG